jgi:hypothetical protein
MTSPPHYYSRKGGGEGKEIRLGQVEPNRCSFRKVPMFGLQQNKQTAELERESNCSIVSQLAGSQARDFNVILSHLSTHTFVSILEDRSDHTPAGIVTTYSSSIPRRNPPIL